MAISPEEVRSLRFLLFSLECEAAEIQAETADQRNEYKMLVDDTKGESLLLSWQSEASPGDNKENVFTEKVFESLSYCSYRSDLYDGVFETLCTCKKKKKKV